MSPASGSAATGELLDRAIAGDRAALEALVARYLPRLRRWAHGRLPIGARDVRDTEDIVQDTVFAAVEHLPDFEVRGDGAFQAYLWRVLCNRLKDLNRRIQHRPIAEELPSDLPVFGPSPLEALIGAEALERYETALDSLSDSDRQLIVLRVEMFCSYEDIVAAMGKGGNSQARVAVSRALTRLARKMHYVRRR